MGKLSRVFKQLRKEGSTGAYNKDIGAFWKRAVELANEDDKNANKEKEQVGT